MLSLNLPTDTFIATAFSSLVCAWWNSEKKLVELKMNGTHQHLAYADDVNLLGNNMFTIKKMQRM
jgi:hypothetical protein